MKFIHCVFGMVIMIGSLIAQEAERRPLPKHSVQIGRLTVDLAGNFRLRGESQQGFTIKHYATGDENFLLSRLRLDADVLFSGTLRAHIQLQDSRASGVSFSDDDFSGNNPFRDPLDINQAFVEITPHPAVKLSIGRQPISFRDRRVFGPGNWGNTGRYMWDAAILRFDNRLVDSRWIIGRTIYHDPHVWPNRPAEQPTAMAVYTAVKRLPVQLDLFYVHKNGWITSGDARLGDLRSHSLGFWCKKECGAWVAGATLVEQFGKRTNEDIRAFGRAVYVGRKLDADGRYLLVAQLVRGSGDKNPHDDAFNTFDGVFGGADSDLYGWMNLFFWKNLQEYRIDFNLRPLPELRVIGEYHYFMLDNARDAWYFTGGAQRVDPSGASGRELGHEIDLIIGQNVFRRIELLAGYGIFFPASFIKNTGPAPVCQRYFLQTTLFY